MAKTTSPVVLKVLLLGDSSVGKTSVLYRYGEDQFMPAHIPTIGVDFRMKTIENKGDKVKLQLWDTAGQERFSSITQSYYRMAKAVLICYDVTNPKSFDNVQTWVRNFEHNATDDALKVLVGNKCDLEHLRVIEKSRGQQLASAFGLDFYEVSAKENINIDQLFRDVVEKLMKNAKKETQTKSPQATIMPSQESSKATLDVLGNLKCC